MVRDPPAPHGSDPNPILEEDLDAFLGSAPAPEDDAHEDDGSCAICHGAPGRSTCVACGRQVCKAHFWTMFGLCHDCASEEDIRAVRGDPSAERYRELLGIKWVE